MEQHKLIKINY